MRECIYKEYKLGTILNVITGYNKLSNWNELIDILEFFNGGPFPDYQLKKVALEARNKILFNNREFIQIDMVELNVLMRQSDDSQRTLNNWLKKQEQVFGSTFLVSYKGELKRKDLDNENNKSFEEKPLQLVKKINTSNGIKISV